MAYARNKVIAGDYNDEDVSSFLGEVSISSSFGKHLFLSMDTVESYEVITNEHFINSGYGIESEWADNALLVSAGIQDGVMLPDNRRAHYITIQFKDGKKSLLEVEYDLCVAITRNCLAGAPVHCDVTPEKIKACDPQGRTNCPDCPCFRCVIWPKCCYGRILGRRAAYKNKAAVEINTILEGEF